MFATAEEEHKELILFVHNMIQCLVVLDEAMEKDKKLFVNVLNSRQSTRRAGRKLIDLADGVFETRAEKLLFYTEVQKVADNAANAAELLLTGGAKVPDHLYVNYRMIVSDIAALAKTLNFSRSLKTKDAMRKVHAFRILVASSGLESKPFFILSRLAELARDIVYGLEKVNEF